MRLPHFLCLIALFASCGRSESLIRHENLEFGDPNAFYAMILARVPKNDNFSLYYSLDNSTDFRKFPAVWVPVTGNAEEQAIFFKLPEKVIPKQIRIDFGNNMNQGDIFIREIKFFYRGKSWTAPGILVFSYFRPDVKKTEFNPSTGLLRGKTINGKRQSPSLYPKENVLPDQIRMLTE